jgi:DNA polymerase III epsilon subunit-like protein
MTASPQIRAPYAVVFDLEFTAWEGSMAHRWLRPGEYTEIIQIGAVKVDAGFAPLATFDLLVRPRLNAELSPYIEKLTGIANAALRAKGVDFSEAYRAFVEFTGGVPILAFGRDDLVLLDNLRLYGLRDLPPLPSYANVIPWLAEHGIDMRGLHACDVGPKIGVPFEGHRHNALADALSVAAGIRAMIGRGAQMSLAA